MPSTLSGNTLTVTTVSATNLTDGVDTDTVTNVLNGLVQAWASWQSSGTVTLKDGYNVSSITDNGTALYTANLTITFANTDYCTVASGVYTPSAEGWAGGATQANKATTSTRFNFKQAGVGTVDPSEANAVWFGALA